MKIYNQQNHIFNWSIIISLGENYRELCTKIIVNFGRKYFVSFVNIILTWKIITNVVKIIVNIVKIISIMKIIVTWKSL